MRRKVMNPKNCPVCLQELDLDYKNIENLKKFLSERGKILGRGKNGLCAKHQRQLTRAVKRARIVALLPFVQR